MSKVLTKQKGFNVTEIHVYANQRTASRSADEVRQPFPRFLRG